MAAAAVQRARTGRVELPPLPNQQLLVLRVSILTGVTMCLCAGFIAGRVTWRPETAPATASWRSATRAGAGPWGELEYIPIKIEPPKELLPQLGGGPARWFFEDRSPEQVAALLEGAGVEHRVVVGLSGTAELWSTTPEGTFLAPPVAFMMSISPAVRTSIYAELARSSRNRQQRDPIPVSPELVESLASRGLSDSTIAQFRSLLYGAGPWQLFADFSTASSLIADGGERVRFARAILRADSFVVRLKLDPKTDIDRILRYWDPTGHSAAERPLLDALTRVKGGADINVLAFLAAMPGRFLNRYPDPSDPVESHADCFWTALNFGAEHVDGHVDDPEYVAASLRTRYQPTGKPPTLGDLIVLLDGRGAPVHAAVYLADDLVFTKNGYGLLHPWTLMKMSTMVDLYRALVGSVRAVTVASVGAGTEAHAVSSATPR